MKLYLRVCAEINLDAAAYNLRNMKKNLEPETKIIAVVKTDGYGHGAVPIAHMAEELDYIWGFAVATIEEAVQLRKAGIEKPVLVLGFVFPDGYEDAVRYDIRWPYSSLPWQNSCQKRLSDRGKRHICILKWIRGWGGSVFRMTRPARIS